MLERLTCGAVERPVPAALGVGRGVILIDAADDDAIVE
jgi:hypothetical protein